MKHTENQPSTTGDDLSVSYRSPAYTKKIMELWAPEYVRDLISNDDIEKGYEETQKPRWIPLKNLENNELKIINDL